MNNTITAFVLTKLPIWYLESLPIECSKTLSCHYYFRRKITPMATDGKIFNDSLISHLIAVLFLLQR